jgi:hypothetical protein
VESRQLRLRRSVIKMLSLTTLRLTEYRGSLKSLSRSRGEKRRIAEGWVIGKNGTMAATFESRMTPYQAWYSEISLFEAD